jgi:hypothetical protein
MTLMYDKMIFEYFDELKRMFELLCQTGLGALLFYFHLKEFLKDIHIRDVI